MATASILIPVRNATGWLAAAIDSALACESVAEVILVDDGSTDDSWAIAAAYGDRIRAVRRSASGGNRTRNHLLSLARWDWVQFLDADDYLLPDKIARQLASVENVADVDVIYGPVLEERWADGRSVSREPTLIDTSADLFAQWIAWQLPQTGGVLWRRESLLRIGGWKDDQPCCQEHELYLRALQAGLRWHFCPHAGAVYRIWSEQTVCRKDPVLVIRERTILIDRLLRWLEERQRLSPAHLAAAGQAFFEMARTWAKQDLPAAGRYFAERRRRGLVRVTGPAAPALYRLVLRLAGFRAAESIARRRRARLPS